MQGALQTSPISIHQPRVKRCNHGVQPLTSLVLFALPDEASHPVTIGEMITLLNRLDGYIGRQIRTQFCHHPAPLQSVLEHLQASGLVASTSLPDECRFWRVSSLREGEDNKCSGDEEMLFRSFSYLS